MRAIYNGIDLGVLELLEFGCVPIYDDSGVDYLYTQYTFVAKCLVNGQIELVKNTTQPAVLPMANNGQNMPIQNGPFISYTAGNFNTGKSGILNADAPPGSSGSVPVPPPVTQYPNITNGFNFPVSPSPPPPPGQVGITPPQDGIYADNSQTARVLEIGPSRPIVSIAAIRQKLLSPRGLFYLFAQVGPPGNPTGPGDLMLQSPSSGDRVDARNGPTPKIFAINTVYGDNTTIEVTFGIETYVNESQLNGVNGPTPLLSNRISQTQTLDDCHWMTIATQGTAIFRTDWVYANASNPDVAAQQGQSPDSIRPLLFRPIPQGFIREGIQVEAIPDVTGVKYQYVDRQVPVNFPAGPYVRAARITALHRQAVTCGNIEDVVGGALGAYERVISIEANRHFATNARPETPARKRRKKATAIYGAGKPAVTPPPAVKPPVVVP